MRVGIIHASSQTSKNHVLFELTKENAKEYEVINFGCFEDEKENYSYIEISILIGLLLSSNSVDFIVTGCSSGQGMMLACNNMPGVICGYTPTPQDSFLFGRINDGNAVSVPLGLNYGWSGEVNLRYTLEALFKEPFGVGYPAKDSKRKQEDTKLLKEINSSSKVTMMELLNSLDKNLISKIMKKDNVIDYIIVNGTEKNIVKWMRENRH